MDYYIYSVGTNYVRIRVEGLSAGDIVRIYCRTADRVEISDTYNTATGSTLTKRISGLDPDTEYVVNVGLADAIGGSAAWVGAQSFWTDPEEEPEPEKKTRIWTGSGWREAAPYLYLGGRWVPAVPYIRLGGTWK